MEKLFDKNGYLNVEDLIMKSESFQRIVEDDIITEKEAQEQAERVAELLKEMEATCTPEQVDLLRRLMAELCVLVSVNSVAI
jgi:hypothetical protein